MSLNALSNAASSALSATNLHGHGRRRGMHLDTGASTSTTSSNTSSIGQLPVNASSALFSNLVQSFQQSIGQTSAIAGAPAAGASSAASGTSSTSSTASTAATPAQQQETQAFMHSLFQALKQDGLGSGTMGTSGAPVSPSTASAAGSASALGSSGGYPGNLASSLQSLIQQLGPGGKSTAATQTLTSTFQNLMGGVGGAAASGSGSSSDSNNTSLRNFLGSLLQNVQSNGVHALSTAGNSVNAHV